MILTQLPWLYYWKVRVVMMPTLLSLMAQQVAIITTCYASSNDKVGIIMTLSLEYIYISVATTQMELKHVMGVLNFWIYMHCMSFSVILLYGPSFYIYIYILVEVFYIYIISTFYCIFMILIVNILWYMYTIVCIHVKYLPTVIYKTCIVLWQWSHC